MLDSYVLVLWKRVNIYTFFESKNGICNEPTWSGLLAGTERHCPGRRGCRQNSAPSVPFLQKSIIMRLMDNSENQDACFPGGVSIWKVNMYMCRMQIQDKQQVKLVVGARWSREAHRQARTPTKRLTIKTAKRACFSHKEIKLCFIMSFRGQQNPMTVDGRMWWQVGDFLISLKYLYARHVQQYFVCLQVDIQKFDSEVWGFVRRVTCRLVPCRACFCLVWPSFCFLLFSKIEDICCLIVARRKYRCVRWINCLTLVVQKNARHPALPDLATSPRQAPELDKFVSWTWPALERFAESNVASLVSSQEHKAIAVPLLNRLSTSFQTVVVFLCRFI